MIKSKLIENILKESKINIIKLDKNIDKINSLIELIERYKNLPISTQQEEIGSSLISAGFIVDTYRPLKLLKLSRLFFGQKGYENFYATIDGRGDSLFKGQLLSAQGKMTGGSVYTPVSNKLAGLVSKFDFVVKRNGVCELYKAYSGGHDKLMISEDKLENFKTYINNVIEKILEGLKNKKVEFYNKL